MKTSPTADAPAATETYAAAYQKLATIADRLKTAGAAADVDGLVQSLREARRAYVICKERLDMIRREVDAEVDAAEAAAKP